MQDANSMNAEELQGFSGKFVKAYAPIQPGLAPKNCQIRLGAERLKSLTGQCSECFSVIWKQLMQ